MSKASIIPFFILENHYEAVKNRCIPEKRPIAIEVSKAEVGVIPPLTPPYAYVCLGIAFTRYVRYLVTFFCKAEELTIHSNSILNYY